MMARLSGPQPYERWKSRGKEVRHRVLRKGHVPGRFTHTHSYIGILPKLHIMRQIYALEASSKLGSQEGTVERCFSGAERSYEMVTEFLM